MESECVAVAVRCRPMNSKELLEGRQALVDIDKAAKQVEIRPVRPGEVPKSYTFDMVFDEEASQLEIYDECAKNIVESVMHGYNGEFLQLWIPVHALLVLLQLIATDHSQTIILVFSVLNARNWSSICHKSVVNNYR